MVEVKIGGRRIRAYLVYGEDLDKREVVLANPETITPRDICLIFVTIAALNGKPLDEMMQLILRGGEHLLEEDRDLYEKVRRSTHSAK